MIKDIKAIDVNEDVYYVIYFTGYANEENHILVRKDDESETVASFNFDLYLYTTFLTSV